MNGNSGVMATLFVVVAMIMFAMGLGLVPDDFRRIFKQPKAVIVGLFSQLVVLPLLGFAIAAAFSLSAPLAVGIVLLTACPGGAHSNLFANLAKGDTALSVTLTAVSGLITVVSIPLLVRLATSVFAGEGEVVEMNIPQTMLQVGGAMIVPVGLGMLVRSRRPDLAPRLEGVFKFIAIFLLVLLVIGSVAKDPEKVAAAAAAVGGAVLMLNVSAMLIALIIARTQRLSIEQAITIVLEVGIQNSTLAVTLALGSLGSVVIGTPIIIYSLLVYFTGALVVVYGRRRSRASTPAEAA